MLEERNHSSGAHHRRATAAIDSHHRSIFNQRDSKKYNNDDVPEIFEEMTT